jgi:RNA methyltransferase, TrmH family
VLEVQLSERRKKEIASLRQRKFRERLREVLVEGLRSVEAAVEAGAPLVDMVVTRAALQDPVIRALAERAAVPVYVVPEPVLERISEVETSQGILATVAETLVDESDLPSLQTILALDGLQDPGNIGTIIRTAAWFGIDAVVAGPGAADFYNPKVVRSAMGGLWDVRLTRTKDLAGLLDRLRKAGFTCYGADLAGVPPSAWKPAAPAVLILGSEAHGLSSEIASRLDERVCVPGSPKRKGTESLNVAMAASILMYRWASVE